MGASACKKWEKAEERREERRQAEESREERQRRQAEDRREAEERRETQRSYQRERVTDESALLQLRQRYEQIRQEVGAHGVTGQNTKLVPWLQQQLQQTQLSHKQVRQWLQAQLTVRAALGHLHSLPRHDIKPGNMSEDAALQPTFTSTPLVTHHGHYCDGCNANPLTGPRHKCLVCPNYDLCQTCADQKIHEEHSMRVIHTPDILQRMSVPGVPATDTIHVFGLGSASVTNELCAHFGAAGPIKTNQFTSQLRILGGYQHTAITYEDTADAENAVRCFNGTIFQGRPIWVKLSNQR